MPSSAPRSSIWLLLLAAGLGGLLIWLPGFIHQQYLAALELTPFARVIFLTTMGAGGLLLLAVASIVVWRIWQATRRRKAEQADRLLSPSEMQAPQQEAELRRNLATGADLAGASDIPAEVRQEIRAGVAALEEKWERATLEIVAFGTVSSGKSSLLNALAGRDVFRSDPRGGTTQARNEIRWPGDDRVVLVDTPGLAEVQGGDRGAVAAEAARDADLVLLVVDGPLKAYEVDLARQLASMEKRLVVCLNKEDWYPPTERDDLCAQIRQQLAGIVESGDVVAVRSAAGVRRRVRVLADGSEVDESTAAEPDIAPLAERLLTVLSNDGRTLLLANLLLQSRGLVDSARNRALAALDEQAAAIIRKYQWAAGGAAAANPIPLLDIAGGAAVTVKMVLDLARNYRQEIDADAALTMLAQLSKNLVAMLGASAAAPAIGTLLGSLLKTIPGVGTIAGGLTQGLVQSLMTLWIGRVFRAYFRGQLTHSEVSLAELARSQWQELTRPDQLVQLIQQGRRELAMGGRGNASDT